MKILKGVALAVVFASPVAGNAQLPGSSTGPSGAGTTSGTTNDQPVLQRDPASKAERDRPQGGSTAGANGRQDPTIKLSTGTSNGKNSGSDSAHRGKPSQGGSTAGANGAQDPTIKSSERVWDGTKGDSATSPSTPSK